MNRFVFLFTVISFLSIILVSCSKSSMDRPLSDKGFSAKIEIIDGLKTLKPGQQAVYKIKVTNTSPENWPAKGVKDGNFKINLGNHLADKQGKILINDVDRAELPEDLPAGKQAVMEIKATAPDKEGDYYFEFDMVQENVSWFEQKGSQKARLLINVKK